MKLSSKPFQEEEILFEDIEQKENHLVLYNDDVNTFEWVIESLIQICRHDPSQAEQCSYIIHYKGKCSVKEGIFEELRPLCDALHDRGLSATIE